MADRVSEGDLDARLRSDELRQALEQTIGRPGVSGPTRLLCGPDRFAGHRILLVLAGTIVSHTGRRPIARHFPARRDVYDS
jgi:hypothetical protein